MLLVYNDIKTNYFIILIGHGQVGLLGNIKSFQNIQLKPFFDIRKVFAQRMFLKRKFKIGQVVLTTSIENKSLINPSQTGFGKFAMEYILIMFEELAHDGLVVGLD